MFCKNIVNIWLNSLPQRPSKVLLDDLKAFVYWKKLQAQGFKKPKGKAHSKCPLGKLMKMFVKNTMELCQERFFYDWDTAE